VVSKLIPAKRKPRYMLVVAVDATQCNACDVFFGPQGAPDHKAQYQKCNAICYFSLELFSLCVCVICFFCVAAGVLLFCRSSDSALDSAAHFWW